MGLVDLNLNQKFMSNFNPLLVFALVVLKRTVIEKLIKITEKRDLTVIIEGRDLLRDGIVLWVSITCMQNKRTMAGL